MKTILFVACILVALVIILGGLIKTKNNRDKELANLSDLTNLKKRPLLTEREKSMYTELVAALPNHSVLAQVSFSALITTTSRATRNRFDRKFADFVICDRQFNVIAIIELDDSSHKGREAQDKDRDELLSNVGYRTVRYPKIPSKVQIRQDVEPNQTKGQEIEIG